MKEIDIDDFWENDKYALENYVSEFPSDDLISSIENELGYKLPKAYVEMMKVQNGGVPKNTCFPIGNNRSLEGDYITITGILGIGRDKQYSLCGRLGSQFMIKEWGYPDIGVCICDCPSAGHDMIMLDYRKNGEPEVVHVNQESDYRITFLAKNFETFVKGLVHFDVYDNSEEVLKNKLADLEQGEYSNELKLFLEKEDDLGKKLRNLLINLTKEKGYFALHADELSYLVYDIQFYLYSKNNRISSKEEYLKEYPKMIALGSRKITTNGYAPGFVEDWFDSRVKANLIKVSLLGRLKFRREYRLEILRKMEEYK